MAMSEEEKDKELREQRVMIDEIYTALLGRTTPFGKEPGFIEKVEKRDEAILKEIDELKKRQAEMLTVEDTSTVQEMIRLYGKWKVIVAFFAGLGSFFGWLTWLAIEYYKKTGG